MIRSLPRLLRNGAFRTAAAFALVFLLAAAVPEAFSLESPSFAQTDGDEDNGANQGKGEESGGNGDSKDEDKGPGLRDKTLPIDTTEAVLSGLILVFLVIIIFSIVYIFKHISCAKSEEMGRLVTVSIVVMGVLFLIISGRQSDHIAPAFGLLGTVAGYLLGHARSRKESRTSEVDEKP